MDLVTNIAIFANAIITHESVEILKSKNPITSDECVYGGPSLVLWGRFALPKIHRIVQTKLDNIWPALYNG